jgi:hypothetical protein
LNIQTERKLLFEQKRKEGRKKEKTNKDKPHQRIQGYQDEQERKHRILLHSPLPNTKIDRPKTEPKKKETKQIQKILLPHLLFVNQVLGWTVMLELDEHPDT